MLIKREQLLILICKLILLKLLKELRKLKKIGLETIINAKGVTFLVKEEPVKVPSYLAKTKKLLKELRKLKKKLMI